MLGWACNNTLSKVVPDRGQPTMKIGRVFATRSSSPSESQTVSGSRSEGYRLLRAIAAGHAYYNQRDIGARLDASPDRQGNTRARASGL